MNYMHPPRLRAGDTIRVIAPSFSGTVISDETKAYAQDVFERQLSLHVTYSEHIDECDRFASSSVDSRVQDLHDAFADPNIAAVWPIHGGWTSNQLLRNIDWGLVKANPKVFCGFSDITALGNAMLAKAGIVTYFGPNFSTLGQRHLDEYTVAALKKCLFHTGEYRIDPSHQWSDDKWFLDQDDRHSIVNEGHWVLRPGEIEGRIMGGTLSVLSLLQGTEYMPEVEEPIMFLEDEAHTSIGSFNAQLRSLLDTLHFSGRRLGGLVIGRFQLESNIERPVLEQALLSQDDLSDIPILANADFGHTDPKTVFPIGGVGRLAVTESDASLVILSH